MSITILIADDHKIVREGLRQLVEKQSDFKVVGEADNGIAAVKKAKELSPDVIIMDIGMPDLNGIEATRQIKAEFPNIKIIALTMHTDPQFAAEMLRAGASSYLLKDSSRDELTHAIQASLANKTYLSTAIAEELITRSLTHIPRESFSAFSILTQREREVLQLIAEGKSVKEIADLLYLSIKTIETHRQRIMDKLNLHSVAKLTKYAIREGLTSIED